MDETKKLELKVLALKERLAQVVTEYEDRVADLRVSLTVQNEELEALRAGNEPVEGEVVN